MQQRLISKAKLDSVRVCLLSIRYVPTAVVGDTLVKEEWRICEYLQLHFRRTLHTDVSPPGGSRLADGYKAEDATEQSGCITKTASF